MSAERIECELFKMMKQSIPLLLQRNLRHISLKCVPEPKTTKERLIDNAALLINYHLYSWIVMLLFYSCYHPLHEPYVSDSRISNCRNNEAL